MTNADIPRNEILICEDNKLTLKTIKVVLEKQGYNTEAAVDGNEAMSLLLKKNYSLVIVDIHLPFHSGLELISYLRRDLRKTTPILIVSAFSDPQMQKQAAEFGIEGYVTKPFNPVELVEKVSLLLNK